MWGKTQGESTGGLGLLVLCWLRWPTGMWGHFSFLILVAGGQIDVGVHVDVHVDRLGQGYVAGLRR